MSPPRKPVAPEPEPREESTLVNCRICGFLHRRDVACLLPRSSVESAAGAKRQRKTMAAPSGRCRP